MMVTSPSVIVQIVAGMMLSAARIIRTSAMPTATFFICLEVTRITVAIKVNNVATT